jgi:hypothetical protein
MMAESEAKSKWCPFARVGIGNGSGSNRGWVPTPEKLKEEGPDMINCVGSACMAWRLAERMFGEVTNNGYCGLAGRP